MDNDLPGLRRLWAPDEAANQEPRLGLSLARIVEAAIELADAGGLDAVTMSRIAQSLGYTTMSLYRHVANKDELLLFMHDTAWQRSTKIGEPASGGWRAGLVLWCREQQAVLRRHPWLERIAVTDRMGTPSQLTWLDRGLRILADTPITAYEKSQILQLLGAHVFWDARVNADFQDAVRDSGQDIAQLTASYGMMIHTVADSDRFPALRQALESGMFGETAGWQEAAQDPEFDPIFAFGLDVILDGVERLIDRRTITT